MFLLLGTAQSYDIVNVLLILLVGHYVPMVTDILHQPVAIMRPLAAEKGIDEICFCALRLFTIAEMVSDSLYLFLTLLYTG